jgi:hypothetical protein
MTKGKTITTYLVDGNPKSIRTCFISNKVCKAIVIPRAKLNELKDRPELQQPSLYILLSESEDEIYVGETEDFLARVKSHDLNKAFWDQAMVFVSKDNDLTKSDIKYLEYLALNQARAVGRYSVAENKAFPKPTNLPEHQLASIEEFFEDINILSSFLGVPVFEKVKRKNQELFYCKGRETEAKGFYSENGFTVLKGATLKAKPSNSYKWGSQKLNKELRDHLQKDISSFVLEKDITFSSPSAASSICLARNSNGWIDWVNESGATLDEVYRKNESR